MTDEQCVKILVAVSEDHGNDINYEMDCDTLEELQKAVVTATKRRPYIDGGRRGNRIDWKCPRCGRRYTSFENYCSKCGQAIDWR